VQTLVTGASGFIGRHVTQALLRAGHQVRALVRNPSRANLPELQGAEIWTGDVQDYATVRPALENVEVVFHLAARVTEWGPWQTFASATVQGTAQTLQAALEAGTRRFVHFSTVAVYDDRCTQMVPEILENTPQNEDGDRAYGPYSRSKVAAETLVTQAQAAGKLETTILRPALVYGPGDGTTLPRMIDFLKGPARCYIGIGNPVIDPIYVDDVAACALRAAVSPAAVGQAYNVSPRERIGVHEFTEQLCRELGMPAPRWSLPRGLLQVLASALETWGRWRKHTDPPFLTRAGIALFAEDRHHSPYKAEQDFGWTAQVPLSEGLRQTVAWIAAQAAPPPPVKAQVKFSSYL